MDILISVLNLYMLVIIARVIISWINPNPNNQIVRLIYTITEPVLQPIRKAIPPIGGTLDISPFIVVVIIAIIIRFLR